MADVIKNLKRIMKLIEKYPVRSNIKPFQSTAGKWRPAPTPIYPANKKTPFDVSPSSQRCTSNTRLD